MKNTRAFPTSQYASGVAPSGHSEGMSLRDYFAAKAMDEMLKRCSEITMLSLEVSAHQAYAAADAMLKARGR